MNFGNKFSDHSTLSPPKASTGAQSSIGNLEDTKQDSIRMVSGIAGWLEDQEMFTGTMFARPGTTVLRTDCGDESGDNIVVILPTPTDIPSLNHRSVFVQKGSVSSELCVDTEVTTYEKPVTDVDWIKVTADDKNPNVDEDLLKSLVSPELSWALATVYPVEVEMRLENPGSISQGQGTNLR